MKWLASNLDRARTRIQHDVPKGLESLGLLQHEVQERV